jgi:hypothetical protein
MAIWDMQYRWFCLTIQRTIRKAKRSKTQVSFKTHAKPSWNSTIIIPVLNPDDRGSASNIEYKGTVTNCNFLNWRDLNLDPKINERHNSRSEKHTMNKVPNKLTVLLRWCLSLASPTFWIVQLIPSMNMIILPEHFRSDMDNLRDSRDHHRTSMTRNCDDFRSPACLNDWHHPNGYHRIASVGSGWQCCEMPSPARN